MINESTDLILLNNCPSCEQVPLEAIVGSYDIYLQDEICITAPMVSQEICKHCNAVFLTPNGCVTANNFIAYHTNQLTPLELEDIRNKYGMSQVEMSKLIGVGDSVYGRWERGTLTPSRAMCNYLRILKKFPEAFEWLIADEESVNV